MKKRLVFATHNKHKLKEVATLLKEYYTVVGLYDIDCVEEIDETADTLEGNAEIKSSYVYDNYNLDCFSDDTGLEVDYLNGAPGVISARYAGEKCTDQDNVEKLLGVLEGQENRKAQFRTVISLIINGESHLFEGIVRGTISESSTGTTGFGYDPIFVPEGYDKSFAELGDDIKNKISHRALAINKLVDFLRKLQ